MCSGLPVSARTGTRIFCQVTSRRWRRSQVKSGGTYPLSPLLRRLWTSRWWPTFCLVGDCVRPQAPAVVVLVTRRRSLDDRAFPVAGAQAWNALPPNVTSAPSLFPPSGDYRRRIFSDGNTVLKLQILFLGPDVSNTNTVLISAY